MTEFRRAGLLAALLVSLALAVAACGGSAATSTPAPVGDATPAPAGEATPAPDVTPVGEATPADAIPTFDLGAFGAIPGVDSYRTSFSVGGVEQYQTVVVTKPVLSKLITSFSDGVASTRYIVVGPDSWMAEGADGKFEPVPAALGNSMLLAFDPTLMLSAYSNLDLTQGAIDQGTESKNGIQAHHLRIEPASVIGAAVAMPPGAAIDLWIAEAGYVVAWEMTGFEAGQDVSIQITGLNDPANKVEAPG